jgi:hypothetical protein
MMAPGKHLCGICSQWHSMHMPDNGTAVPFCKECWQKLSVNARAFAITQCRVATVIENLDRTIFDGIDGQIATLVEKRLRDRGLSGDN